MEDSILEERLVVVPLQSGELVGPYFPLRELGCDYVSRLDKPWRIRYLLQSTQGESVLKPAKQQLFTLGTRMATRFALCGALLADALRS